MAPSKTIALANETDGPGGAEVLIFQLAEELRERGYDVVPVLRTRRWGWLHDHLEARGFRPETVDLAGASAHRCVSGLREVFRRRDVDLVHSHEFTMSVFGALAARSLGIPHVITMHGNQHMTGALRRRLALRLAFRLSRAVVAVSHETREHLVQTLGKSAARVQTILNGVPRRHGDPYRIRQEFGLGANDLMVLSVGGLHKRKGHALLIQSLARLRADRSWKLIIAGRGPEQENLDSLIRELDLVERVHLVGQREDVPDLQAAANLFVMPSLWEGLPLAILEAMLAGTPVIASAASGIPEAIEHGVDGLLVPPGDLDALTDALTILLSDARLREKLGRGGMDRAMRDFTISRMADDYITVYENEAGLVPLTGDITGSSNHDV